MINIFIADDHAIVREGLKQIIIDKDDMSVTGEAGDGYGALEKLGKEDYDVVLLDISLPGISGIEILRQVKTMKPEMPILILSVHPEEQYALRAIKAGASGYLEKDSPPEELIRAIRNIYKGQKYVSSSFTESLLMDLNNDYEKPLHQKLSDREFQVLNLIARGKTSSEIADKLSLSIKTISTYKSRVMKKMGFRNNIELVRYALEHDLTD